ncbi:flagellar hook-basal body complex protein FliE [Demequina capsici]|uniref:Flagellar hook-basal body complex protein FliE n=1 Tax=Demequina capsici TaxID=3075620 RepID=A0AA96J9L4_9MICO|nr:MULTISPECIES: flagellar hook-basal body complex protein FliE [unclassified Demequina]WNM24551.1 flagellar hook-basal body complex protein FliE [Demequina sp. OYTSA14]WNM27402.1 flagellar hook-basal body complex protein FliE [Demequina sp. PMTSA13]
MTIPAISAVTSTVAPSSYLATTPTQSTSATDGAFASTLASAVDNVQGLQSNADSLAIKAVTGDLADVHQYTIAATEASVTLELAAAVRNKAVDAFSEIMRMQA